MMDAGVSSCGDKSQRERLSVREPPLRSTVDRSRRLLSVGDYNRLVGRSVMVGCSQNPLTGDNGTLPGEYPQAKEASTHSRSEAVSGLLQA